MKFDFTQDEVVQILIVLDERLRILEADMEYRGGYGPIGRINTLRALRIKIERAMEV